MCEAAGMSTFGEPLELLYRSERFVAVDKPAGLRVHPEGGQASRDPSCQALLRDQLGTWVYPVHRLDRATSGVLVFALDPEAATRLGELFRAREVGKSYLAVVRGHTADEGVIDVPLTRDFEKPESALVESRTLYKRIATAELPFAVGRYSTARYSLVRAEPRTGRRHQIRRHLARLSHPVIGDTVRGDGRHNRFIRERFGIGRLLLHSEAIWFGNPFFQSDLRVESKLTSHFRSLLTPLFPD
jgi:tRNA pseudouridine65 synthase